MSRFRKITATVASVALLGAGGLSAAQAATTSKSATPGSARAAGKRPGGPLSTAQVAAIAKTLGVTSTQLKAALDRGRTPGRARRPRDRDVRGRRKGAGPEHRRRPGRLRGQPPGEEDRVTQRPIRAPDARPVPWGRPRHVVAARSSPCGYVPATIVR